MANANNNEYMAKLAVNKLTSYLYEVNYTDWDYTIGADYCERFNPVGGACSAVRNGEYYGRNYDWKYDNCASFVIRCNPTKDRHGSIGIAGSNKDLTDTIANSGKYTSAYKVLPFQTVDGINDCGVVCNVNVVPTGDKGYTTGTNPNKDDLLANMLVRYILDYADSAKHAIDLIKDRNIIMPHSADFTQEFHWMIADEKNTYVVEFINNAISIVSDVNNDGNGGFYNNKPIMTNFYLTGFNGNTATRFYKSSSYNANTTKLTKYSAGVERFDILSSGYADADNKRGMIDLMKSVRYTNAYKSTTNPQWLSEFVGDLTEAGYGDLSITSLSSAFTSLIDYVQGLYANKQRNGKLWQTVHTTVYDIPNRKMWVIPQETNNEYSFTLDVTNKTKQSLKDIYKNEFNYISAFFTRESVSYNEDDLLINIDDAWRAIASYLWIDYDTSNIATVKAEFEYLICKLAMAYFNNAKNDTGMLKGNVFVQQQSQGSRSVSFRSNTIEIDNNGLTAEVKAALPPRKLRVI